MAAGRRRRSTSTKARSGSTPPRKRRTVTKSPQKQAAQRQPSQKQVRKKRVKTSRRKKTDWKLQLQKWAIGLFFVADVVLIYFFIQHCSTKPIDPADPTLAVTSAPVEPEVPRMLQIEVLNGCGVSGIAAKYTEYLRDNGFDVVKTDNYKENGVDKFNMPNTIVIDRRGIIQNAMKVGKCLGLPAVRVLPEPHDGWLVDATVVLGEDYNRIEIWKVLEQRYD